jgi:hypothetical protein
MSLTDLDRFKVACAYPGKLDERAVKRELAAFLWALGVHRRIVRLRACLPILPRPFNLDIEWILAECVKRNKPDLAARAFLDLAARAFHPCRPAWRSATDDVVAVFGNINTRAHGHAHAARDGSDAAVADAALDRAGLVAPADAVISFAFGALDPEARALRTNGRGSIWELSRTVCELFRRGFERGIRAAEAWQRPLLEAFVCGCWLLYLTDDTLYWVAKPTEHREPGTQRLHHDTRAALESDLVNLYFWHGVMVPALVILKPDLITIADIDRETNAEVRRVMIERYRHGEEIHGAAAFIRDAGGERLDYDERYGTLWRRGIPRDEPIVMVEVVNRTRELDGSFKRYWLRVPPGMRTAR